MNKTIVSDYSVDKFLSMVKAHPFVIAALTCFSLTPLSFGQQKSISSTAILFLLSLSLFIIGYVSYKQSIDKSKNMKMTVLWSFLMLCFVIFNSFFVAKSNVPGLFVCALAALIILVIRFALRSNNKKFAVSLNALTIAAIGFIWRFMYILITPITVRQHDVNTFGGEAGHAAYIEYLLNYRHLPDFDVTTRWQFYHPPLYHTISACWLGFLSAIGVDYGSACESIQILTLFYSVCCMIIGYKILKYFKLNGKALLISFAVFALHPTFIIFSGSINNDVLSVAFLLGAILNTLYWYRDSTVKNIVKIALCIGLGMMTKMSVALIAPAVAFVFIAVLYKKRKYFSRIFAQFVVFGVICVPLGMWWSLRSLIKWNIPISYVPLMPKTVDQYVGNISILQRLTDFSAFQFTSVFDQFGQNGYFEFNPSIALFKTAVFGEGIREQNLSSKLIFIPQLLFWLGAVLAVVSLVLIVVYMFRRVKSMDTPLKLFILIAYGTLLLNYYVFCFTYPFTCTQNIRYISPLILIGALFIGLHIQKSEKRESGLAMKCTGKALQYVSIAFVVMSILTFSLLAYNVKL